MVSSDPFLQEIIQKAFPNISPQEADKFISIAEIRSYPADQVLCQEGQVESTFYIIVEGEVRVSKKVSESEERTLNSLGRGDFFGEYALLHDAPRMATITTVGTTEVMEISRESFNRLLSRNSNVSMAMVRVVSERLRETNEMSVEDLRLKAGELAQAYQQLAEMDFARREFLTAIAHELRTPLTAATGFLQGVKMGIVAPDQLDDALETAASNLQKIIALVNDILFLQEMDLIMPEPDTMNLGSVVRVAVNSQRNYAKENGVNIETVFENDLPQVRGGAKSLERVFSALIQNAIKFSPGGGRVVVTVGLSGSQEIAVRIRDWGVGIPEEALPYIFDRFYHLDQVEGHMFGGLGLGLAIAHQVIAQHGGEIQVTSYLGEGSLFTVKLPL